MAEGLPTGIASFKGIHEQAEKIRGRKRDQGVDVRRLYDWLGTQIEVSRREHEEYESCTNLDMSVGPRYHAEAFAEVRRQMRRFDKSLPKTSADRI